MKLLLGHAYSFSWGANEKITDTYTNCVVAKLCFQPGDSKKVDGITKIIEEYVDNRNQKLPDANPKTETIVLFPFAHLTPITANPTQAQRLLRDVYERLNSRGFQVYELPFGTNKRYLEDIMGDSDAHREL